jgi:predicted nuclease with TOPRIM domain
MSYPQASGTGTAPRYPQQKDNRKLIYGILIAALLGTWGYIIFDKNKNRETVTALQSRITNVDSARNAIQQEFMIVSAKADSLTQNNLQLHGDLADKSAAIQKLRSNITSILKKKNASEGELAQAKQMIGELNGKVDGLVAEVDRLKGENQVLTTEKTQLTAEKTQLTADKQNLEENLNTTKTEKKQLEEKVDVASTLHASNINIAAVNVKSSGKEKETSTAKRADLMRISFNLDENRITPSGTKDIYVVVTAPDGKVISEGGTFNAREEGARPFTSKVSVNYEQGKNIPVNFDWRQSDKYLQGDYKIEVYNNGFKIGQGVKTLKKGGLFS